MPRVFERALRRVLSLAGCVAFASALFTLDRWLVVQAGAHSETGLLLSQMQRALATPQATVVVLGQSTMGQWLTPAYLADALAEVGAAEIEPGEVLDGHLAGCHQDCSWAEVRSLLEQRRHFERAFYGLNLYQMCDANDWKRALQHTRLVPVRDLPRLFELYTQGGAPLRSMGRWLGASLSHAYADPPAVQEYWYRQVFGPPGRASAWYQAPKPSKPSGSPSSAGANDSTSEISVDVDPAKPAKTPWNPSCNFSPEKIAGKLAFTRALLDSLAELADHTYVLTLPDRTLASDSAEDARRWQRHRQLLQELTRGRPHVSLVDLASDGAQRQEHFRDGVHLSRRGLQLQRRAFEKQLRLGERP